MATIMTVTGPISSDQLGFTLVHEHVFLDATRDGSDDNLLNDPELAYQELMRYVSAGGVTLVDQTNGGLRGSDQPYGTQQAGSHLVHPDALERSANEPWTVNHNKALIARDFLPVKHALAVRQVAERTGLNIILGSGWYRETYYWPYVHQTSTNRLAEDIVRDLTEGIDGTDVRAGIIGEIGCRRLWVTAAEERMLRAAARAHKQTGATIATSALRGPIGLDQLDILEEEGVDPHRVIIGYAHMYPNAEYQAELARRGAFIAFEHQGHKTPYHREKEMPLIRQILEKGLTKHLLLSHEVCQKSMYAAYGGAGYDYIPTRSLDDLKETGLTDEQFHEIMVDNPRRALTGED